MQNKLRRPRQRPPRILGMREQLSYGGIGVVSAHVSGLHILEVLCEPLKLLFDRVTQLTGVAGLKRCYSFLWGIQPLETT